MTQTQTSGLALLDNVADFALSEAQEETSTAAESVAASALVTDNVDETPSASLVDNSPAPEQQPTTETTVQAVPTLAVDMTQPVAVPAAIERNEFHQDKLAPISAVPIVDAANEREFDGDKYQRLLEGGGKLTEKEVRALINHLEKLIQGGNLNQGQGFFSSAEMRENREKIIAKAQEIHGEIAELLKVIFDAFYIAPEAAEEQVKCEEEERKARNKKANMMDQVAVAGLR